MLHPTYKLKFTNWLIAKSFDGEGGEMTCKLNKKVESSLRSLSEEYSGGGNEFEASSQKAQLSQGSMMILMAIIGYFLDLLDLVNLNSINTRMKLEKVK